MWIKIYGASDDLVEVEGDVAGADEYYVPEGRWAADLIAPGGDAMRVEVTFERDGWRVQAVQADEAVPMPDWPVEFVYPDGDPDGDETARIDVPAGTRLDNVATGS